MYVHVYVYTFHFMVCTVYVYVLPYIYSLLYASICVLGSWYVDGRYGFLLRRLSHVGLSDLKYDGVSGVLPRYVSFNGKVLLLASHLRGPQSCTSAMEPR